MTDPRTPTPPAGSSPVTPTTSATPTPTPTPPATGTGAGTGMLSPRAAESRLAAAGPSALRSEYGTTTIADGVVAKIAALATREISGVAELGGAVSGAISGVVGRITGASSNEPRTAGVSVEVGETQAAVDLTLKVLYPASIHEVADAVRQNVRDRIQSMTGLDVVEVNIGVVDLVFPGEEQPDAEQLQRQSRVE
jgi:uncharacterized alkaline shock family protein YloU